MAELLHDPARAALEDHAREARLRYMGDERPGVSRELQQGKWVYRGTDGKVIRNAEVLRRIQRLAIPPAWTDVWICPQANGHLQATGRDARGRKQYCYHADWRQRRDENKFEHMQAFGKALPRLRAQVQRDLRSPGLPRAKVLAAVVRLLEATLIRVGNDEYARSNRSFGLTTLRNRHVRVRGKAIQFDFTGKSGKRHTIGLADQQLARIVSKCHDLPGQELFAYVDEAGQVRDVTSQDVNDYLHEHMGEEFTAKDFRTWAGTVLAAIALRNCEIASRQREAKMNITAAIEAVAHTLGNTPAVCRKSYIHPAILDCYLDGRTIGASKAGSAPGRSLSMRAHESAVLRLLQAKTRKRL